MVKKHLRRVGEGVAILLILWSIYELATRVIGQSNTLLYLLLLVVGLLLAYGIGYIIED